MKIEQAYSAELKYGVSTHHNHLHNQSSSNCDPLCFLKYLICVTGPDYIMLTFSHSFFLDVLLYRWWSSTAGIIFKAKIFALNLFKPSLNWVIWNSTVFIYSTNFTGSLANIFILFEIKKLNMMKINFLVFHS